MSAARKTRGLARGLDDLIGSLSDTAPVPPEGEIALDKIEPNPYQPRRIFAAGALEGLASSIKANGILQPILVRPKSGDEGRYEIIAGERRFRAAELAGMTKVPVIVRSVDDQGALTLALLENLQREDLRPVELARGLKELTKRFGLTQRELARALGVSREQVSNTLRLLKLPEKVRELLDARLLTPGHGRLLASLDDPEAVQALAESAAQKGLTVRELDELIAGYSSGEAVAPPGKTASPRAKTRGLPSSSGAEPIPDPDLLIFEEELMRRIGTRVKIRPRRSGQGRIIIEYYSPDELAGIIEKLTGRFPV